MVPKVGRTKIILYFVSCFMAFIGGHMMNYTAILYAQDVLGSDMLSGIGFGLCFGPPIVLGWFAGVYSDRMAPTILVIGSQLVFVLATLLFIVVDNVGSSSAYRVPLYLMTTFLVGVGWSFIAPSRLTALAQIVSARALHQASVVFNLLIMVGFGLAPILIAVTKTRYDWRGVMVVILCLFLAASILLLGIKTKATVDDHASVLSQTRAGIDGVLGLPILRQLIICSFLIYGLMGVMQVLLPKFAASALGFGEMQRGLFLGVLALSLIIGGVLCMMLAKRIPIGLSILAAMVLGAASIFAISFTHGFASASAALLLAGIFGGYAASLIVAGLQQFAPPLLRGRVLSIYTITSQVVPACFGLMAGVLSQSFGVVQALQYGAAIIMIGGAVCWFKLGAVRAYRFGGLKI